MKYTSPPTKTSPAIHRDRWEEAIEYAEEPQGLVWCQCNICCDSLCFCAALASVWRTVSTTALPRTLHKHRTALGDLQANTQSIAERQQVPSCASQTGQRCNETSSRPTHNTAEQTRMPRHTQETSASMQTCTVTPSVLQTLAGGFTRPVRDMHSPMQLSFDSEATVSANLSQVCDSLKRNYLPGCTCQVFVRCI
jgi:hypothetical protein